MHPAVFLDRDGVLIEDVDLLTRTQDIRILPNVPTALRKLHSRGFLLIVVSNQTVVARGLLLEQEVLEIEKQLETMLESMGSPSLDGFYFCPHHPSATLPQYRVNCECRKPNPGLLLQAVREQHLDLSNSFMIGDRITDILAGEKANCRTVLVKTGMHAAPPIQTDNRLDNVNPDHVCNDLNAAADWILEVM